MKTVDLVASSREGVGKKALKQVRASGAVPGIVYGLGDPMTVSVDYVQFEKVINTSDTYIINLNVDSNNVPAVIREVQFHPVTDQVLHVDFIRISDDHPVEVQLPIELVGTAKGVANGGKLVQMLRYIKVSGIASQLPEKLEVDVTHMTLGMTIKVSELEVNSLVIKTPADAGVAVVDIPRAVKTGEVGELDDDEDEEEEGGEEA